MTIRLLSVWRPIRAKLSYCKRQLAWLRKYLQTPHKELVRFRCNVCGKRTSLPDAELKREMWSCRHCGSSVRWRSVIHALSSELFGQSLVIGDFPHRPDLTGIGLSDWTGYADRLSKRLGYTNTFFHTAPLFDITHVDPADYGRYDFIISSDVFEHVCAPISRAFENACKLLKPGGVMILTVPYLDGETREHFPGISGFQVEQEGENWVLIGTSADGSIQKFTDITFHGGPGTTVECRVFGKETMMRNCIEAGFDSVRIYVEEIEDFGIRWHPYDAEKAPYRPYIYGLDTPPWALVKGMK